MFSISGLSIKARIWGGYGLVLTFLVAVTALGYFALQKIGGNVEEFDRVSDNTVRVLTIDRNVTGLRRNVLLFTGGNADERALGRIRDLETALRKDLADAASATRSAERKTALVELSKLFEQYIANVGKVVEMQAARKKAVDERMNPLGAGMRQTLTEITVNAFDAGKFDNAARAGMAQEALLLARLNAVRFLGTPDQKLAEAVHQKAKDFNDRINDLLPYLVIPANIERTKQLIEDGKKYVAAFDEVARIALETDRIINTDNAAIASRIGDLSQQLRKSQLAALDKLGTETLETVASQQKTSSGLSVLAIVLGLGCALVIARSIIGPIQAMTAAMGRLAHGDLAVDIPARGNRDEIGEMAEAVQVFKDNAIEKVRMDETERAHTESERRRQQESEELIDMFGSSVSGVFHALSGASQSMADTAQSMKSVADDTNTQIDLVSREVGEAEANAQAVAAASQAVAAASQELTAAIGEISRLVNDSSQVAEQGSAQATEVVQQVSLLRDASEKIGNIVGIISNIATQSNLLALNATIEAARAGDAGKGFAVVAGEVKNLSGQTQKATIEISAQITEIQNSIGGTVGAVQAIGETVIRIYQSSTEIAAAITEQQSATDEIARNIQFVSSSTERIGQSMVSVRESADRNNVASTQVHQASSSMSGQTEKLSVEVGDFLTAVKGAGTRHQFERLDTNVRAHITVAGANQATTARQISIGGAWLEARIDQPPGSTVEVTIDGIPRAPHARIAGVSDKGTRLQFPMDSAHLSFMADAIARLRKPDSSPAAK